MFGKKTNSRIGVLPLEEINEEKLKKIRKQADVYFETAANKSLEKAIAIFLKECGLKVSKIQDLIGRKFVLDTGPRFPGDEWRSIFSGTILSAKIINGAEILLETSHTQFFPVGDNTLRFSLVEKDLGWRAKWGGSPITNLHFRVL